MKKSLIALSIGSCLFANTALADIYFNGFASIVAGTATSIDDNNPDFNGYTDSIDFKQDSLFALQATADVGEGLSVTAQILSRGNDDWTPKFEWAYIAYEATDNLRLLAGRQRAPFYMYSDFLDVSYAYSWITPPKGVYALPFDTFDGVGAIYSNNLGEVDATLHAIYGANTDDVPAFGETVSPTIDNIYGASLTLNRDWLTVRGAYFVADLDIPIQQLNPLIDGWQQAGFANIADNVLIKDDQAVFTEFGFQMDYNGYMLIGEYTKLTRDGTPLADEESYYVMAGKQFNTILLSVTYGADEDTKRNITAGVPTGVNPGLDALVAGTQGIVNSQLEKPKYVTLGLRWDFHDSAAFKLEYTDYTDDLDSTYDASLLRAAIVTVF